jgi:GNAT superfamily N-acetyltransferase
MVKNLRLSPCLQGDWEFILELRNKARKRFFNSELIEFSTHAKFMTKHSLDYFVCFSGLEKIGFIGCVDRDIRLVVKEEFRKKGVAKFMVSSIIKLRPSSLAVVKETNKGSIKLFESCGFKVKEIKDKKVYFYAPESSINR